MLNIICPESIGFASNTYVIESSGVCAVIDPSVAYSDSFVSGKLEYIFLTHAHFDHMLELDSWASATGARIYVSTRDRDALRDPYRNCYKLFLGEDEGYFGDVSVMRSGDRFAIGDDFLEVMETPGHTPGSVVLYNRDVAFVGDTVFSGGGYGRWDLPGGSYEELVGSIKAVMALDGDIVLYPGHGPITTVKEFNGDIHLR